MSDLDYYLDYILEMLIQLYQNHLWNISTAVQIGVIVFSYALSLAVYGSFKKRLATFISEANLPAQIRRVVRNLPRLIVPSLAMVVTFLGALIIENTSNHAPYLTFSVVKLLLAWVGIRLCLQFIDNNLVRNIAALSIWIITALSIFGILDETKEILDVIGFGVGDFRLSALVVIKSVLALFFLLYIATFISQFLERSVLRSKSLKRSSQVLLAKIIRISLIVVAVIIGLTSAGVDLSIFAVLSGAIGLGIGFGLQKVVSNLFSGLLLLMDQSIKPGDVIELENSGTFGWVNQMAARYTEIVTRDNKSYLIPNEEFITQRVVNWSHGNNLVRLDVTFGVHYDSDPHQVIALAQEAAIRPERVVSSPDPVCWMTEFGDSSLNFSLRFWIKDAAGGVSNVQGQVLLALWDVFKEHNIQIPYPHREVFLHQ